MTTNNYYIKSNCIISNQQIWLNNTLVFQNEANNYANFIKEAYKKLDINYSKFFKMDNLSKLAFIASDLLLKKEANTPENNNTALIFSNKSSSLNTDKKHQKTIQNIGEYYPSPAIFVYTLPNICLGEISIKYNLHSENSFFIFENFNASHLFHYANQLLNSNKASQVLCGWVNLDTETNYEAFLYLVANKGNTKHEIKNIITLYNKHKWN